MSVSNGSLSVITKIMQFHS